MENPENEVVIDQLDEMDLTNTDTSRPIIPAGPQPVTIVSIEAKQSTKGNFKNIHIQLSLDNGFTAKDGKTINPGFKHTESFTLKQTDKYDPRERLARVQECFLGRKGKWNTSEMIGQKGTVRFQVEPEADGYPEKNGIASWIKKKVEAPATL